MTEKTHHDRTTIVVQGALAAVMTALFLFSTTAPALALEFHVAPSGDDGSDGSESTPWQTLVRAAGAVGPGDTVWVHEGVYYEQLTLDASGTDTERIAFLAAPGENPVIDGEGTDLSPWSWFVAIEGDYVDVEGFEVRNSTAVCLGAGGDYVNVRGCDIHHCFNHGVVVTGTGDRIDGNSVYEAIQKNAGGTSSSGWDVGMETRFAHDAEFTNNRVYHNYGEGIDSWLSYNTLIRGNVVYDNFSVNIYSDNAKDCRIESNFVYCTGDSGYEREGDAAAGILVATEDRGEETIVSERITVVNNIVVSCGYGFGFADWPGTTIPDNRMTDVLVANNTFVNNLHAGISIGGTQHPGSSIVNNIVYQDNEASTFDGDTSDLTLGWNCWYGPSPGEAQASTDIVLDPRLEIPGGLDPVDSRILEDSPCRDTASARTEVAVDFFGTPRPQPAGGNPDIGAHEFTLAPPPDDDGPDGDDIVPDPAEPGPPDEAGGEDIGPETAAETGEPVDSTDAEAETQDAPSGGCSCRVSR
jgi:parallel beta-helix repeat protein